MIKPLELAYSQNNLEKYDDADLREKSSNCKKYPEKIV